MDIAPTTEEQIQEFRFAELGNPKLEAQLREHGYLHYGIFADDPGALEVFDEIERQRNLHMIGGE